MWINNQTLSIYHNHAEIRRAFSQVSMPATLTEEVIELLDVSPISQVTQPTGYVVEEVQPIEIEGVWTQQWQVRPPTEQETSAKTIEVRAERNRLLTDSDWTQVKDAPVDQAAWAAYRQALRDITQQAGFPWEITWPEMPQ